MNVPIAPPAYRAVPTSEMHILWAQRHSRDWCVLPNDFCDSPFFASVLACVGEFYRTSTLTCYRLICHVIPHYTVPCELQAHTKFITFTSRHAYQTVFCHGLIHRPIMGLIDTSNPDRAWRIYAPCRLDSPETVRHMGRR